MRTKFQRDIEPFIIFEHDTFEKLLEILDNRINFSFGSGFALVVDNSSRLVGVIEDSDIRKFLRLHPGENLQIKSIMRKDFISIEDTPDENLMVNQLIFQIKNRGWNSTLPVRIIPIISDGRPIAILDSVNLEDELSEKLTKHIVIGLGYVGITLALTLAEDKKLVYGFDIDSNKIEKLNGGETFVLEPGIEALIQKHIGKNLNLVEKFGTWPMSKESSNIYYICIGTPLSEEKLPNLNFISLCIDNLLTILKTGDSIIMRSTVPIGTGDRIIQKVQTTKNWIVGVDFHYISAPERTVEGNALSEIRTLPQIVGAASNSCIAQALNIFKQISVSVITVPNIKTSELIKIMGNAYRDYIFGFSNYIISICQQHNIDVNLAINASNSGYSRSSIPMPSPGVGGPCLTKDSYFLVDNNFEHTSNLLIQARNVNAAVPLNSIEFIERKLQNLSELNCLCIGIAFKGIPETNDIRHSTAVDFIEFLSSKVRHLEIWDAVSDLKNLKFNKFSDTGNYNFVSVLNNHLNNSDFASKSIFSSKANQIIVYDPWRLLEPGKIRLNPNTKILHYFSLSHYELFQLK
jgi:UDP-N-acetyl-D-mannosaminuronic acid dehydrogenase